MKTEFKIGQKVVTPVSDDNGEVSYLVGTLLDINSRFAKVQLTNGEVVRVGCSKVEPFVAKATPKAKANPKAKVNNDVCPDCGSRDVADYNSVEADKAKSFSHEFTCLACGHDWGRKIRRTVGRIAEDYRYIKVKAASGRTSCDNDDQVAILLRGKDLDEVYWEVAKAVGIEEKSLHARYHHLNPGQQRMCLGNLLRGHIRKQQG